MNFIFGFMEIILFILIPIIIISALYIFISVFKMIRSAKDESKAYPYQVKRSSSNTNYCINCGERIAFNSRFCKYCGEEQ